MLAPNATETDIPGYDGEVAIELEPERDATELTLVYQPCDEKPNACLRSRRN